MIKTERAPSNYKIQNHGSGAIVLDVGYDGEAYTHLMKISPAAPTFAISLNPLYRSTLDRHRYAQSQTPTKKKNNVLVKTTNSY